MKIHKSITVGEIITLIVSVVAIVSTSLIAGYTIYKNDKNVASTSRAFLFIDKTNMTITPDIDGGVSINIPWKNFGMTPATEVLDSVNSAIISPAEFDFPDQSDRTKNPRNSLAPGGTLTPRHNHFSSQEIKEMFIKKQTLYTWAWIEYGDVFSSTRHRTEFCVKMTVKSITPEIDITEMLCDKFNGFDNRWLYNPKTTK